MDWNAIEIARQCVLSNNDANLSDVVAHNPLFCDACRDEVVLEKTKGEEMLFRDIVPYWMESSSDGSKAIGMQPEGESKPTRKRKRANESKKKSEEIDAFLPTGLALHKLVKQGLSKSEALEKFVEEKRKSAKNLKEAKEKVQAGKNEMPWAPLRPKILANRFSIIERPIDHQRYVAILSNFLNPNPQTRFQQNKKELQFMDEKLAEERREFQSLVMESLENRKNMYRCGNKHAVQFILNRMNHRLSRYKGMYGAPVVVETNKYSATGAPPIFNRKKVLHYGETPKLIVPNERRRFAFTRNASEIGLHFPLKEQSIESDDFAIHLAMQHGVAVVMGASSAMAIMCRQWLGDSSNYFIPVKVKLCYNEQMNHFQNICLLGKPFVDDLSDDPSLWYRFVKLAVKTAVQPQRKTSQKSGGRQRSQHTMSKKNEKTGNPDLGVNNSLIDSEDDETLIIAENDTEIKSTNANVDSENNDKSRKSSNDTTDILDDIMNEINTNNLTSSVVETQLSRSAEKFDGAALKKRYSVFNFGYVDGYDAEVLVRANNDGIDSSGSTIALAHKIEYAPEFGAERMGDEEWLRHYLLCKFKCASHLLRFRIHHNDLLFLQKETCLENMMTANRQDLLDLVIDRTILMRDIVFSLQKLKTGNYLLKKEAGKFEILSELNAENRENVIVDLNSAKVQQSKHLPSPRECFHGIDEHFVLVYHIVQKRIPASFGPKKEGEGYSKRNAGAGKFMELSHNQGQLQKPRNKKRIRRTKKQFKQVMHRDLDAPSQLS